MGSELTPKYKIVSADMTVEAMRESGYKSTAHALAELIDNAIEANATLVELIVVEEPSKVSERVRYQVDTIGVLDNGCGMDGELLRQSLRFGAGTRKQRKGMGRFGVGLPSSSMSQCKRVDVWSWQNGPSNALHTYLDLAEVTSGAEDVPEPVEEPLPDMWQDLGQGLGTSGTLVVWTKLDKVQWRGAGTTLKKTEELIGRVYRRFIVRGDCRIRMVAARDGELIPLNDFDVRPNDPLYLTVPSSTPAPFDKVPMFELFGATSTGELGGEKFDVKGADGKSYPVYVRTAVAREAARISDQTDVPWPTNVSPTQLPGSTPWGQHAARNLGISLVRADRELALDTGWVNSYNPTERFWGIEIDFPPQLDEVFGVTNNKQGAMVFSEFANFNWQEDANGQNFSEYCDMLDEEGDPRRPLIEIVYHIREKLIKEARKRLQAQTDGTRSALTRHADAEQRANEAVKRRRIDAAPTRTEQLGAAATPEQVKQEQVESLVEVHHLKEAEATRMIEESLANGKTVRILPSRNPESPAFFGVEFIPNMLQVSLNKAHPVYEHLVEVLDTDTDGATAQELAARIARAADALKLLLVSWGRYEDELPTAKLREEAKEARQAWGKVAAKFLTADEGDGA
jgi:hypothetical protein